MSSVGEPSEGMRSRAGGYTGYGRSPEPKKAEPPGRVVLGDGECRFSGADNERTDLVRTWPPFPPYRLLQKLRHEGEFLS